MQNTTLIKSEDGTIEEYQKLVCPNPTCHNTLFFHKIKLGKFSITCYNCNTVIAINFRLAKSEKMLELLADYKNPTEEDILKLYRSVTAKMSERR